LGVSATAVRNVPTKPIRFENWRCRSFGGFVGFLFVFYFREWKGLAGTPVCSMLLNPRKKRVTLGNP